MVNTRRSSRSESISISHYISSRTRSSVKNNPSSEEHHHKDPGSDVSSSGACLSPPAKRTRRLKSPVCSDSSPSPLASVQREEWRTHTRQSRSRLSSSTSGNLQNGHSSLSRIGRSRRNDESGSTDHSRMNGNIEVRRSCRSKRSRFESVNQSMLFDQLVNSTAEAVLQEMDSMSNIRQNREVERLRMWTDTEFVSIK